MEKSASPDPGGESLLEVRDLRTGYDALEVIHGLDLDVAQGEVVGVLGANGAGKTTLLRAVSGAIRTRGGTVRFLGEDVTSVPAHVLARRGIGHVPSGRELFANMTVQDNLDLGAVGAANQRAPELQERVYELFPALTNMLDRQAGTLSGGEQQMLAVGRALMTDPKLLLLDEPSTGLAPTIVTSLFDALRGLIESSGIGIVLVEQNAALALRMVSRAVILRQGRIVVEGSAAELSADENLIAAYLGA